MTLVSVIMPAFNAERYLAASIESVLTQTFRDWELIVVDDGSTDATAEIVKRIASEDERIKYVYQSNGRLGKARNTGIAHAHGSLIAFLDSDDLWMANKLELQVKAIEQEKADLVYSNGFIFRGDDITDESVTFPIIPGQHQGTQMFERLLVRNSIPVLSVIVRREALERAGPFEERAEFHGSEDYDLWLRLAKQGAIFYGLEDRLVRYRRHASAMTHCESDVFQPMLAVVKKHCKDSRQSEREQNRIVRGLYRDLIAALVLEGNLAKASAAMEEFAAWDRGRFITRCQRLLLKISPRNYALVSRECLYRIEWHASRLVKKLRPETISTSPPER